MYISIVFIYLFIYPFIHLSVYLSIDFPPRRPNHINGINDDPFAILAFLFSLSGAPFVWNWLSFRPSARPSIDQYLCVLVVGIIHVVVVVILVVVFFPSFSSFCDSFSSPSSSSSNSFSLSLWKATRAAVGSDGSCPGIFWEARKSLGGSATLGGGPLGVPGGALEGSLGVL